MIPQQAGALHIHERMKMRQFSTLLALFILLAGAETAGAAEPLPIINQKHQLDVEFRGPISISAAVTTLKDGTKSRSVFGVIHAGPQEIVLTGDDADLEKKLDFYCKPRHGDKRIHVAHVKGRLEFRPRTDSYRPARSDATLHPHLIVKSIDIYFAWPGTLTRSGPQVAPPPTPK